MPGATVPAIAGELILSDHDRRLLELLATGLRRSALAEATGSTPTAISRRLRDLRRELGARTDLHAVVIALRNGLIS